MSGMRFYDRKEIKTALAYARLIVEPPRRGVGAPGGQRAQARHRRDRPGAARRLRRRERPGLRRGRATSAAPPGSPAGRWAAPSGFATMLDELRALANDLTPREMIDAIVRESGMGDALRAEDTDEALSRLENLGELAQRGEPVRDAAGLRRAHGARLGRRPARRRRRRGLADDPARGQGARVPGGRHHRPGGDGLPAPARARRRRRARGGAPPLLRRASRAPCATSSLTHAWTRTLWGQHVDGDPQPVPDRDPGRPGQRPVGRRAGALRAVELEEGFVGRDTDFAAGRAFGAAAAPPVRSTGAEAAGPRGRRRVVHTRYGPGVVTSAWRARARTLAPASVSSTTTGSSSWCSR